MACLWSKKPMFQSREDKTIESEVPLPRPWKRGQPGIIPFSSPENYCKQGMSPETISLTTRLKNFLRGWLLVLGLKEGLVECATVCVRSNFTSVRGSSEQSLQRGWLFPPFAALWHNKMPCQHGDCSRHVSHKRTGVEYNFSPDHNWLRSFLNF